MSSFRALLRAVYFSYSAGALLAALLLGGPFMLLLPTLRLRRSAARIAVRLFLGLAGIRLRTTGLEQLPEGATVLVANHCSYLDGPVLFAALPPRFAFVVKAEASRLPAAGLLLRRLHHEFVDRFNRHRGAVDARRILRRVASGQSMVFFPEGTITPAPGLGRFHTGAFLTAVRAGVPVVPVVIRGTRHILPADRWRLKPGRIEVEVMAPLAVAPDDGQSAASLRDRAQAIILAGIGPEPAAAAP